MHFAHPPRACFVFIRALALVLGFISNPAAAQGSEVPPGWAQSMASAFRAAFPRAQLSFERRVGASGGIGMGVSARDGELRCRAHLNLEGATRNERQHEELMRQALGGESGWPWIFAHELGHCAMAMGGALSGNPGALRSATTPADAEFYADAFAIGWLARTQGEPAARAYGEALARFRSPQATPEYRHGAKLLAALPKLLELRSPCLGAWVALGAEPPIARSFCELTGPPR